MILGRCIQGAAGSTILASGLSLLTVASSGSERLRAVSLWGAASAVGAAAGPLIGGVLVDSTGWQGLFWIDAAIAVVLIPITLKTIAESLDPNRSRSIDWFGTVLVATILAPLILAVSKGIRVGLVVAEGAGEPRRIDRVDLRVRCRRAAIGGAARRPGTDAQQAADRSHARHPDRRRNDQRSDVRRQPVFPGSVERST